MNKYIQGAYFVTDHLILSLYYCNYLFQLHFSDQSEWPPVELSKHASLVTGPMLLISRCTFAGLYILLTMDSWILRTWMYFGLSLFDSSIHIPIHMPQASISDRDLNADAYIVYCLTSRLSWAEQRCRMQNKASKPCMCACTKLAEGYT